MRDNTNKFVNNKDFGVIAKSSRGSNTPTQVGDMNQRELYNAYRGQDQHKRPLKHGEAAGKVGTKEAASAKKGIPSRILNERRNSQRSGGKVK
jgi:hypothetical protein